MIHNTRKWKIKTVNGYQEFDGVSCMGKKPVYTITFTDNTNIVATANHRFFTDDGRDIYVHELMPGVELLGVSTNKIVSSVDYSGKRRAFDIINTVDHTYSTNSIISHNCEFLSSDALLIDSAAISMMEKTKRDLIAAQNGFTFYSEIKEKETYLIGVDPATGTSLDFSVIEIYHFPTMLQVAEFRSNTMSSPEVYTKLKWIIKQFELKQCQVYFSVENNGVGEGILALYQNDEHPPASADLVSEEGKDRLGMTTTAKSKMRACLDFRIMVERGNIAINSPILYKEMKTYTRKGGGYEAQAGSTDDCISATLICIRLLSEIATYEQDAFDKLYTVNEEEYTTEEMYDENDEPLPMLTDGDDITGYSPL